VIQAFLQGAALDTIFSSPQYVTQNVLNGNITYSIANAEILGSPFQPSLVDPTQPNIFAPGGTTITVTGPLGIPVGTLTFDPEGQSGIGSISYSVLTPVPGLVPVPNFPDATITGSQFLASQPITVNNAAGTVSGSINEITIKGVDEDGPFQGTIVTPVAPITIGPGGVTTGPTGQYPLNIEPDGTLDITVDSSGTQVTWAPDGSGTVLGPDGSTLLTLPPGSITGTMQTSDNSFALTLAPNSSGVPGTLSIDGETGNLQLATDGLTESAFPIDYIITPGFYGDTLTETGGSTYTLTSPTGSPAANVTFGASDGSVTATIVQAGLPTCTIAFNDANSGTDFEPEIAANSNGTVAIGENGDLQYLADPGSTTTVTPGQNDAITFASVDPGAGGSTNTYTLSSDGSATDTLEASGTSSTVTLSASFMDDLSDFGSVGGLIGSELAKLLALDSGLGGLGNTFVTAFFSTSGQQVMEELGQHLSGGPGLSAAQVGDQFVDSFGGALFGYAGSQALAALFTDLGLNPALGSTLGNVIGTAFGTTVAQDLAGQLVDASGNAIAFGDAFETNLEGGLEAAGVSLLEELAGINLTQDEELGQSIGGTIGGIVGSFIPGVGTVVGNIVGQVIGTLVGSIFGPPASVGPDANSNLIIGSNGVLSTTPGLQDNGGQSLIPQVEAMANSAASTINGIVGEIGGAILNTGSVQEGANFTEPAIQQIGFAIFSATSEGDYVDGPPSNSFNSNPGVVYTGSPVTEAAEEFTVQFDTDHDPASDAVANGVIRELGTAQIVGGDAWLERAFYAFNFTNITDNTRDFGGPKLGAGPLTTAQLQADLQVASLQESFVTNPVAFAAGEAFAAAVAAANSGSSGTNKQTAFTQIQAQYDAELALATSLQVDPNQTNPGGSQTYLYHRFDEAETIDNADPNSATNDNGSEGTIEFDPSLAASDFAFSESSGNLVLTVTTNPSSDPVADTITVTGFFSSVHDSIGEAKFINTSGATVGTLSAAELAGLGATGGTSATLQAATLGQNVTLVSNSSAGGAEVLSAEQGGTVVLEGGAGNDQLFGGTAANVTLDAGTGDQSLYAWLANTAVLNADSAQSAQLYGGTIWADDPDSAAHVTLDGDTAGTVEEFSESAVGGGNILNADAAGTAVLHAGAGNDTLTDGTGLDTLIAGSGDDTLNRQPVVRLLAAIPANEPRSLAGRHCRSGRGPGRAGRNVRDGLVRHGIAAASSGPMVRSRALLSGNSPRRPKQCRQSAPPRRHRPAAWRSRPGARIDRGSLAPASGGGRLSRQSGTGLEGARPPRGSRDGLPSSPGAQARSGRRFEQPRQFTE